MPTVDCKLIDCANHGREICIAKNIVVDGVGQCESYDPVPRSNIVHEKTSTNCRRIHGAGSWLKSRVCCLCVKNMA